MATRTTTSPAGPPTQDRRVAKLDTPFGKDKLLLSRFECSEGLSELFEIRLEVLSETADLDFDTALARTFSLSLSTYHGKVRDFSGLLTEAQWVGIFNRYHAYKLLVRPWLWFLDKSVNSRIFKNMTILEIIKKVFKDAGFGDQFYKIVATDTDKLEYCVQYRESDFAFVSRLMEDYGYYYYFRHEGSKHVMHITDSIAGHDQLSITTPVLSKRGPSGSNTSYVTGPKLPFLEDTGEDRRETEHLYEWTAQRKFRTGKFELRDYDYLQAKSRLRAEKTSNEKYEKARDVEHYYFPGGWTKQSEGDHFTKVMLEAEQAADRRMYSEGDAPSLYAGLLFTLDNHPCDNGDYLVVRTKHTYEAQAYRSGGVTGTEGYTGAYEFQEKLRPFRAPQITPHPRIQGPHTAFVVAREGTSSSEEIDVDEHGRIFVNFHWNRGDKNKDCSRAVRIAQLWAGKGWGFQFIPRIGMEVVVEFLEGDPDYPLVTGCVYNSDFPYPWTLPGEKTKSGVKTDSSLNNADKGYNQFRFEDKTGSEEVNFRAEKDLNSLIQHQETREIGRNYKGTGPSRDTTLVHGTEKMLIETGDWKVDVSLGKIEIEAMQSITLTVGTSKLTIDQTGITLEGMMLMLDGKVATTVKGAATLTLKGGLTTIN